MIELPRLGHGDDAIWSALLDLAERAPDHWTLVGGQMVLLHGLEHGQPPPRVSHDLDLVVDARVGPLAIPRVVRALQEMDFALVDVTLDEFAHRFSKGDVVIDIMAPDGVGESADMRIQGSIRAIEIRGGSFALSRSEPLVVRYEGRVGIVQRPDLCGALVIKSEAAQGDRARGPDRHLRDLAFLYSLVGDPLLLRDSLSSRNRRTLRKVSALHTSDHESWRALGPQRTDDAYAAYTLITRP